MKKQTNRKEPVISITATLSETRLLKKLVEQLASIRRTSEQTPQAVQPGWESFSTSSIEAFVSGDISLTSHADFISMPFVKSFVFTCIKTNCGSHLVWSCSLS